MGPDVASELASIVQDPARPLASLAVLAIRGGETVYQAGFGRRRIDAVGDAARVTPSTLYRIASISKLVVALGVMRLVEEGLLDLDADVGAYLGWRLRNPHFPDAPITLRMLLSHTAALRDDAGYHWPAGTAIRDFLDPAGSLHGGGAMWSTQVRPGDGFGYANLGSGVIATATECVTGERFDRLMRRIVLEPLGMAGGFEPAEFAPERVGDIATLYRKRAADDDAPWNPGGPWVAQVDDFARSPPVHRAAHGYAIGSNGSLFGPQGNLRASVADLARVMRMLMNEGMLEGRRFLRAASVGAMLSEQWHAGPGSGDAKFLSWGLGVQRFLDVSGKGLGDRLVEDGGFVGAGHLGDAYGLTGVFAFDPASRDGMIVLVGGTGFDPVTDPGAYSALNRYEERILTALYRRALRRE